MAVDFENSKDVFRVAMEGIVIEYDSGKNYVIVFTVIELVKIVRTRGLLILNST